MSLRSVSRADLARPKGPTNCGLSACCIEFDKGQNARPKRRQSCIMTSIIFKCPRIGMNVQHRLVADDPQASDGEYEPVECPACTRLHFVNKKSGKLLGEK